MVPSNKAERKQNGMVNARNQHPVAHIQHPYFFFKVKSFFYFYLLSRITKSIFRFTFSIFCSSIYSDRAARTEPKAYCISGWWKCNISHSRNPLAWKRRDNCWLAFASTGGTGWLSPIMGELRLPCCASRHYNWHWERNRFSKSLSAPCIIHTYAQKNTSVPLHTHSHTLSCSEAYVLGDVECVLIHTHLGLHRYACIHMHTNIHKAQPEKMVNSKDQQSREVLWRKSAENIKYVCPL